MRDKILHLLSEVEATQDSHKLSRPIRPAMSQNQFPVNKDQSGQGQGHYC